jgi:predicted transcriptional regulator
LDLRYEGYRLRQPRREAELLSAIAQEGIREPLLGVTHDTIPILLDGFKRCRCARQLQLHLVPFVSWATDEVVGIFQLLRADRQHALSLLEQARFVDELHTERGLSVAEIAHELGRSKAWVSLRLGLLQELSPVVREALFAGAFPVYAYLYTLRPFRRLKGVTSADLDQFVRALSGAKLSVRQIEGLAHGFFRGPASFRQEILQGHLTLALRHLEAMPPDPDGGSEFERIFLQDLEQTQKAMLRVLTKSQDPKLQSSAFRAQCNLLTAALLGRAPAFFRTLRQLHDRTGQA